MDINLSWVLSLIYIFEMLVRLAAFFVVPRNRKPSSATAWLIFIMIFPTIGFITFLLIGSPKLSKKRQSQQRMMTSIIEQLVGEAKSDGSLKKFLNHKLPPEYKSLAELNTNFSGLPVFGGNKVKLIPEYQDSIDSMVNDIRKAEHFVHIEFFIIALDDTTLPLFEAMREAVKRGVKVRLMFDALGSRRYPRFKEMKQTLTDYGIEWHPMLPLKWPGKDYTRPDLRNHRKLVVVDAKVGYTGSLNLIHRTYHRKDELYYDELMARVEGPVVTQLHGVFVTDWHSESGELLSRQRNSEIQLSFTEKGDCLTQVLPSGPGFADENNLKLFNSLIYAAKERIVITNPYFVPEDSLMQAITTAAQRGVEVVMINSTIMDQKMVGHAQRSYYEQLLKAGVKVYWYEWPILLHSKHMTVDDDIAVIGSSNLDIRSFELDLEISLVVYDKELTRKLHKIEDIYLAKSQQLSLEVWRRRPRRQQLMENLFRLTAALQ